VQLLKDQSVTVLVDLRLTPISRKPGLSKTALSRALNEAGIGYVHHRALGNPKPNREGYRAGIEAAHRTYRDVLKSGPGRTALSHVSELLEGGAVALLCFERDHSACHRHQVVDELSSLRDDVTVVYA
jgi:uncharacterized protein (DUF488 family)